MTWLCSSVVYAWFVGIILSSFVSFLLIVFVSETVREVVLLVLRGCLVFGILQQLEFRPFSIVDDPEFIIQLFAGAWGVYQALQPLSLPFLHNFSSNHGVSTAILTFYSRCEAHLVVFVAWPQATEAKIGSIPAMMSVIFWFSCKWFFFPIKRYCSVLSLMTFLSISWQCFLSGSLSYMKTPMFSISFFEGMWFLCKAILSSIFDYSLSAKRFSSLCLSLFSISYPRWLVYCRVSADPGLHLRHSGSVSYHRLVSI